MYAAVLSRIGPVKLAVTTSLHANFLRRPKPGDLLADGRLIKCGRRLAYGEVTLVSADAPEDPVCQVTRSEGRSGGKECVSPCRSRSSRNHKKKKKKTYNQQPQQKT